MDSKYGKRGAFGHLQSKGQEDRFLQAVGQEGDSGDARCLIDLRPSERGGEPMAARPFSAFTALLTEEGWTAGALAQASRISLPTIKRAVRGAQLSARTRAKVVAAINARRAERRQPALPASEIFPTG